MSDDQCESAPAYTTSVKLSSSAIESMRCMFLHGPTYDGNIPSKAGRDELFDLKLATRIRGYSWLTAEGMRMALDNGLDRDKERWERDRRRRMIKLDQIESILMGNQAQSAEGQQATDGGVMGLSAGSGLANGRPTIEGLERLLKPEPDGRV